MLPNGQCGKKHMTGSWGGTPCYQKGNVEKAHDRLEQHTFVSMKGKEGKKKEKENKTKQKKCSYGTTL